MTNVISADANTVGIEQRRAELLNAAEGRRWTKQTQVIVDTIRDATNLFGEDMPKQASTMQELIINAILSMQAGAVLQVYRTAFGQRSAYCG